MCTGRTDEKTTRDVIRPRQLRQRGIVGLDVFETHGSGVSGDVVGAGQNDHHLRMQVNHILAEADQHLRRGLSADAAVQVRLAGEIVLELPDVGDGIAEKDDAVFAGRGRLEGGVGVTVAGELAEVVGKDGDARGPILVEAGEAGGGNGGLLLGRRRRSRASSKIDTTDRNAGDDDLQNCIFLEKIPSSLSVSSPRDPWRQFRSTAGATRLPHMPS